jgi:GNAT superfamily N-acetyltransferase
MANCYVKEVTNSGPNVAIFRRVSRESSGECFNPPERSRLFFAYERGKQLRNPVIGVGSYTPANWALKEPASEKHEDDYYHILSFLFVDPYHQKSGCGSQIVKMIEKDAFSRCKRDLRVMSAEKAVRFFEKNKFTICGDVLKSACAGSPLFNRLTPMEKVCPKRTKDKFQHYKHDTGFHTSLEDGATSNSRKLPIRANVDKQTAEFPGDKLGSATKETVLQWNISNFEVESTEDWDNE